MRWRLQGTRQRRVCQFIQLFI